MRENDRAYELNNDSFSEQIRALVKKCAYDEAEREICAAMATRPHDAEPHNLMGILMEYRGDHIAAMKHFRAAWALDPAYRPAKYNMDKYADFADRGRREAYNDSDLLQEREREPREKKKDVRYKIVFDMAGLGHKVKR